MHELIGILPSVLLLVVFDSTLVDVADHAARWDPDDGSAKDHGTDNIIAQETHHLIDVDVLDDVPESLHDVLDGLLAGTLVTESLDAGSAVG